MTIYIDKYTHIYDCGYMLILPYGYIYLWMGVLMAMRMVGILHIRQYSHTHGNT